MGAGGGEGVWARGADPRHANALEAGIRSNGKLVFLAVLFAALCHAGWNALIKVGLDPLSTTTLIAIGSGVVALVLPAASSACRLPRPGLG